MKELSIKDKAKRYDEALDNAKVVYKTIRKDLKPVIEQIFPELRESGDERMWKLLKKYVHYNISDTVLEADHITREYLESWLEKQVKQSSNILWHDVSEEPDEKREIFCEWKSSTGIWYAVVFYHADSKTFWEGERIVKNVLKWTYVNEMLEKQGEQKPIDKVEPKFEIIKDKWYVCTYTTCTEDSRIWFREGVAYLGNDILKYNLGFEPKDYQKCFRLWTIEDAKDGDVLRLGCVIAIFKSIFKNSIGNPKCICYCSFCEEGNGFEIPIKNGEDNVYGCIDTTPATKEQRDLLFAKMREAGYTWDADKKELIKL